MTQRLHAGTYARGRRYLGHRLDVLDDQIFVAPATRHYQRATAVNDEVDMTCAEIGRRFLHLAERAVEMLLSPVVDVAGDAHKPDALRREPIEVERHHLQDRRRNISDTLAGSEHS